MKSWITTNSYKVYRVLKGRSNAYLVSKANIRVLIDTGNKSAYPRLQKNIESLESINKLTWLVLTHTHYDHCQNAARIKKDHNCRILMCESEAEFVRQGYTPLPKGTFGLANFISWLGRLIGKRQFGYEPFEPDLVILDDADWSQIGLNIRFLVTGGHSRGSMCVIIDDEIAIVGDEMMGVYTNSVFVPFADEPTGMIRSWGKLLQTSCALFLPGHGFEVKRELLQKEYLKYAAKRNIEI